MGSTYVRKQLMYMQYRLVLKIKNVETNKSIVFGSEGDH